MKSIVLTKVNSGSPSFKDLVGLSKVEISDFTQRVAASIHKNATQILSDDKKVLNVCTNKGFYEFYNYSNKYILRIGSPSGEQKKKWFKIC